MCAITLGSVGLHAARDDRRLRDASPTAASITHPQAFESVRGPNGKVISLRRQATRVLTPNVAARLTGALQGVVQHGTGTAAALGSRPVAGKTGTAENFQDAWFCGYVPQLATCVWVGYPKGEIPLLNVEGVGEVFGGTLPAEIWHNFMGPAVGEPAGQGLPDARISNGGTYISGTGTYSYSQYPSPTG